MTSFAASMQALCFLLTLATVGWSFARQHQKGRLPPGPKPIPLIGNLFQLPHHDIAKAYASWKTLYGDIIYMRVFARDFIILNSAKMALDLLDEQGANYSNRPHLVFAGDMVGRGESVLFHQYGERLKKHRKLLRNGLNTRRIPEYWAMIESESWRLLAALLIKPKDFFAHFRRHSGAITLRLAYGYKVKSYLETDYFVALAEKLAYITTEASEPGRWLVDSFPFLQYMPTWLPGTYFQTWAKHARIQSEEFTNAPYEYAKSAVTSSSGATSYTAEVLEYLESKKSSHMDALDERFIMWNSASIYAGGTDTTVALIEAFFLYMTVHPDVQAKAQAELDEVVGIGRLPTMEDEARLPYIQALIKELHRFNPIVPLIPHSPQEDGYYDGYFIPKKSWIMANSWAIMHDPQLFQHPERFWPGRYLPEEGNCIIDPRDFSYGFGRRRCPGLAFANAVIFITVSYTLSTFTIQPEGTDIPPLAFTSGHVSHPEKFSCNIQPRSATIAELINELVSQD